ncbi:spore coat protein GerQ [Thermoflavimicrobium dichotomicum]|uniref:Spore germination protein Q n=1 Tax=Thermoflavimicrobium dichotomicum TaxID=46223 RepID=A0A1I3MH96_9BACL|nr:spore coat protein GerQ [Thermoflavimicrobium dichotomicum]SFI96105.1 spore germination protein Q [Thermoflavimicrobium dichotomicum]
MYWYYPYANVSQQSQPQQMGVSQQRDRDRVFSEDFLQNNIGRKVTVYLTFEENTQWNAKKITGTLRAVGRDYFVIRDQVTGKDHMFLNINLDYFVFEDKPAVIKETD